MLCAGFFGCVYQPYVLTISEVLFYFPIKVQKNCHKTVTDSSLHLMPGNCSVLTVTLFIIMLADIRPDNLQISCGFPDSDACNHTDTSPFPECCLHPENYSANVLPPRDIPPRYGATALHSAFPSLLRGKRPPVLELYPCVQVPLSRRNYYNPEHTIVRSSFLIMDNLLSIVGVLAMLTIKMLILNVIRCGLYLRIDEFGVACHLCNFLEYDCVVYGLCCILAPGERSVVLA